MRKSIVFLFLFMIWTAGPARGSIDLAAGGYGITLGHAHERGQKTFGLNLSAGYGEIPFEVMHGLAFGLLSPYANQFRGIAIGGVGVRADQFLTGLAFGGYAIETPEVNGLAISGYGASGLKGEPIFRINGISLAVVGYKAKVVNGAHIAGLFVRSELVRGFSFAIVNMIKRHVGIRIGVFDRLLPYPMEYKSMTGLSINLNNSYDDVKGIQIGALNKPEHPQGQTVAGLSLGVYNSAHRMSGLQIGLWNRARVLNGIQIGLINYAGNSTRYTKLLPIVNVYFD